MDTLTNKDYKYFEEYIPEIDALYKDDQVLEAIKIVKDIGSLE